MSAAKRLTEPSLVQRMADALREAASDERLAAKNYGIWGTWPTTHVSHPSNMASLVRSSEKAAKEFDALADECDALLRDIGGRT